MGRLVYGTPCPYSVTKMNTLVIHYRVVAHHVDLVTASERREKLMVGVEEAEPTLYTTPWTMLSGCEPSSSYVCDSSTSQSWKLVSKRHKNSLRMSTCM